MTYHLDHVQIAIPRGGEDAARAFYVAALGFEEVQKPAELEQRGGLWLRSGAAALHLGVEDVFTAARKAHPALSCPDYDVLLERLQKAGFSVTADPLPFHGRAHCYIADPFGNRIELIDRN